MLDLKGKIEFSQFFKWWGQELSFLLPEKFREILSKGKSLLVIEIASDKASVCYVNRNQESLLGEFEINALGKEELQNLIESNNQYNDLEIVLRVPEIHSVKQTIFLPNAVEANLDQVIGYELDRYTPFDKNQVYFDYIKLGSAKNNTHIHVLLIMVKKATLDRLYDSCLLLGLKPFFSDSVVQKIIPGESQSRYNLLAKDRCQKTNKTPLFILLGSFLLTLVMFVALLVIPLSKATDALDELKQHAQKVERLAFKIDDSKKDIDYLYQATQKVIDQKNASPALIEVIDTVSKVLNDVTWISRLHYFRKTLQITGQSDSATNLIDSLEKTKVLKNVKFISSVTKDKKSGLERFKISTEVAKEISDAETE